MRWCGGGAEDGKGGDVRCGDGGASDGHGRRRQVAGLGRATAFGSQVVGRVRGGSKSWGVWAFQGEGNGR